MFQVKHLRRAFLAAHRRMRELQMIAKGLASTGHPILAHVIPMRRCNLSCTYCNEFDDFSKPVPVDARPLAIIRSSRVRRCAARHARRNCLI